MISKNVEYEQRNQMNPSFHSKKDWCALSVTAVT